MHVSIATASETDYTLSMKDFDRLISQRAWTRMENKPYYI
jgi:hypothetical protein